MKKILFTIGGRRLEVELNNEFAQYVLDDLEKNVVALDRDNETSKLFQLYLQALSKNFNTEKQIETFLVDKFSKY